MSRKAEVVVCGAGIAGVSAAYHLAKAGFNDILMVDPLPPLSLTSDRSTECYRNWWTDAEMVGLMNRSIDLMEQLAAESGNVFRMNRRGYLYVTADESKVQAFQRRAAAIAELGAGRLRLHAGAEASYQSTEPEEAAQAWGADLLLEPELIHRHFPYVTERAVAALHVRRAGWLSAQQLGMYLLERAKALGVRVERTAVARVDANGGRVTGVILDGGEHVDCAYFVVAAGPYLRRVGQMLRVDLPVQTELHLKLTFKDTLEIVQRDAPLLIWDDSQFLPWDPDERAVLEEDMSTRWLTAAFPEGAHLRPEGSHESQTVLMLWDYKSRWMEPVFPPPLDETYPEVALRGLSAMIPGLRKYFDRAPRPYLDGGYYVKTPENRLLASPLPVKGAFVIGGLSGFGIMSSCAAGEMLAAHMAGTDLPRYAPAFSLDRYADSEYQTRLADWDTSGQL